MAVAGSITIDVSKLPKEEFYKGKKGVYYTFNFSIQDNSRFGKNMSFSKPQTKEEQEAKAPKQWLNEHNGFVYWTDGNVSVATKDEEAQPQQRAAAPSPVDDLPF